VRNVSIITLDAALNTPLLDYSGSKGLTKKGQPLYKAHLHWMREGVSLHRGWLVPKMSFIQRFHCITQWVGSSWNVLASCV